MTTKPVTVKLPPATRERVQRLMEKLEVTSMTQVIVDAIRHYEEHIDSKTKEPLRGI